MWLSHKATCQKRMACNCSPLPEFRATLWTTWYDASSLGLIQLWYSKLTAAFPAVLKIPSGIQEDLCSQYWNFKAFTYFQYNLILWYYENGPKKTKMPCLKVLKKMRRVSSRVMYIFLCQLNKFVFFFFLSIFFVLSSLHYGKCTVGQCPQWIYIWVVARRLICMTNLNIVLQYNLVLNCKMQKSGIIGDWGL